MFDNAAEASTCEQCGADLNLEVLSLQLGEVCRHCDSYNDPGVRVCVSCGKTLDNISIPPGLPEKLPTPVFVEKPPVPAPSAVAPATTGEAWMAAPSSPLRPAAKTAAPAPPSTPTPALPLAAASPSPAAPRASSALPPSALPPGWATGPKGAAGARVVKDAVTCPNCQTPNPPTARYCGSCGFGMTPAGSRARGKLILIRGIAGEGRQFPLTGGSMAAGKTGAVSFPEDPYIGALHATFFYRGDDLVIKDEGAGNGVYVRLKEGQVLRPGDMFSIGEHLLRYAGISAAPAVPAARHGSPRTSDRLQVIEEILEGGGTGRVCKRPGPSITIGRVGCDLSFPSDGFISARHAELSLAGETPFLRDLGSANGTFVRILPRTDRVLKHGDYLLLGRELLRVEIAASR
jgi:pSer/pThr/pTyr-binding forkhead associated (FHA) protein